MWRQMRGQIVDQLLKMQQISIPSSGCQINFLKFLQERTEGPSAQSQVHEKSA